MSETSPVTILTIRVALTCYAVVIAILLAGYAGTRWRTLLRALWTIGCAAFILHVLAAFHYSHHWSHAHAVETTARQTRELMGWAFGEGLYFSYLFLGLWVADVAFWWLLPNAFEVRPRWVTLAIHAYLFFIAFNGAIIFEPGVTRPAGIVATLIFMGILVQRRIASKT